MCVNFVWTVLLCDCSSVAWSTKILFLLLMGWVLFFYLFLLLFFQNCVVFAVDSSRAAVIPVISLLGRKLKFKILRWCCLCLHGPDFTCLLGFEFVIGKATHLQDRRGRNDLEIKKDRLLHISFGNLICVLTSNHALWLFSTSWATPMATSSIFKTRGLRSRAMRWQRNVIDCLGCSIALCTGWQGWSTPPLSRTDVRADGYMH